MPDDKDSTKEILISLYKKNKELLEQMNLQKFILDNMWGIIVGTISVVIVFTMTRTAVNANADSINKLDGRVTTLESLVVKVAVQDEKINTISSDVKEIKQALNIK